MRELTVGELFAGYSGIGMAVQEALGGRIAWVSDIDPGACKILAHRLPDVPNLGDITAVDWAAVEPVDVLTGGFPCQDVSCAGLRAGMRPGTRSGLWAQMAYAVSQLRPPLVIIENVRGLLSANAHSDLEPCPWCLGDDEGVSLRALGGVLGDLAELGYDASWTGLRASDVGAPHGRFRVFIIAWPATHADRVGGDRGRLHGPGERRGAEPAHRGVAAADTSGDRRHERRPEPARLGGGPDAAERGAPAAAKALGVGGERRRGHDDVVGPSGASEGDPGERQRHGDAADDRGAVAGRGVDLNATPTEVGPGERLRDLRDATAPQEVRQWSTRGSVGVPEASALLAQLREQQERGNEGRPSLACSAAPRSEVREVPGNAGSSRAPRRPEPSEQRPVEPADSLLVVSSASALAGGPDEADGCREAGIGYGCHAWGQYASAIHRWEVLLGRLAPPPTELSAKGTHRLSSRAVEFIMGLPAGWVTDVPGLTRNEQLKALGNGVVPAQAAAALRLLLPDVGAVAA